jgi:hypothetical protein
MLSSSSDILYVASILLQYAYKLCLESALQHERDGQLDQGTVYILHKCFFCEVARDIQLF